jgi:thioesterase domain-containing protein
MTKEIDLQNYLYTNIPLSEAMGIQVLPLRKEGLSLKAPLSFNINHKKTAFGGSIHSIATLSCWTYLHSQLTDLLLSSEIVIASSSISYLMPIHGDFIAKAGEIPIESWKTFLKVLKRKKKAKIRMKSQVFYNELLSARFEGSFAAFLN